MEEIRFMSVPSPMRVRYVHPVEVDGQLTGWDPAPWKMVVTIRQYRSVTDDDHEQIDIGFIDIHGNRYGSIEYFEGPIAYGWEDGDSKPTFTFQLQYQGPEGWIDVCNADETPKFITA